MKRKAFFILLFLSFLLNAHPPKSIDLSYDAEKAVLSVKIWHNVSNPENHYIKKITVFLGDVQVAEITYKCQQTGEYQEELFIFSEKPLKKGALVKVKAACNIFGKKAEELDWEE
jgi:desulfoferrodoxin (superoxide reductase-like protein)